MDVIVTRRSLALISLLTIASCSFGLRGLSQTDPPRPSVLDVAPTQPGRAAAATKRSVRKRRADRTTTMGVSAGSADVAPSSRRRSRKLSSNAPTLSNHKPTISLNAAAPAAVLPAPATRSQSAPAAYPPDKPSGSEDAKRLGRCLQNAVESGSIRLTNAERDGAQIAALCHDGRVIWPSHAPRQRQESHSTLNRTPDLDLAGMPGTPRADALPPTDSTNAISIGLSAVGPASRLCLLLSALAERASPERPCVILSLFRPPYRLARYPTGRATDPHACGMAVDIRAFSGAEIREADPEQSVRAVLALLEALPPGRYRLGLPRAPRTASSSEPLFDPAASHGMLPFELDDPIPGAPDSANRAARGGAFRRSPAARGLTESGRAAKGGVWPFFPAKLEARDTRGARSVQFAPGHYAAESALGDARLREALQSARARGADVFALFPDGTDHVHIDVKPTP